MPNNDDKIIDIKEWFRLKYNGVKQSLSKESSSVDSHSDIHQHQIDYIKKQISDAFGSDDVANKVALEVHRLARQQKEKQERRERKRKILKAKQIFRKATMFVGAVGISLSILHFIADRQIEPIKQQSNGGRQTPHTELIGDKDYNFEDIDNLNFEFVEYGDSKGYSQGFYINKELEASFFDYKSYCEVKTFSDGKEYLCVPIEKAYEMADYAIQMINEMLMDNGFPVFDNGTCIPSWLTKDVLAAEIMNEGLGRVEDINGNPLKPVGEDSNNPNIAVGCMQQQPIFTKDVREFASEYLEDLFTSTEHNNLYFDSTNPFGAVVQAVISGVDFHDTYLRKGKRTAESLNIENSSDVKCLIAFLTRYYIGQGNFERYVKDGAMNNIIKDYLKDGQINMNGDVATYCSRFFEFRESNEAYMQDYQNDYELGDN